MTSTRDAALRALTSRQHNLATTSQLEELGFSRRAVQHRRTIGELQRVFSNVHRVGGAAATPLEPVMAALLYLGPEATASHHTAAAIWGLPGYTIAPVHILLPRRSRRSSSPSFIVHSTRVLDPSHIAVSDGIRVTTPARTIRDLAPFLSDDRFAQLVDKLWAKKLLTGAQFAELCRELAKRGRSGTVKSRAVSDARLVHDYRPVESNLEGRANAMLEDEWPGEWRRQVETGDELRRLGRMDFRHRVRPAVLQVDSALHHASITDAARDDAQTEALLAAGYVVIRVSEWSLWYRLREVIALIALGMVQADLPVENRTRSYFSR